MLTKDDTVGSRSGETRLVATSVLAGPENVKYSR
jgi:hypothetical protein